MDLNQAHTAEPTIYSPLPESPKQLRLLRVVSHEAWIECELSTFDFDDRTPSYRALSYTWGPSSPVHQIWVNGYSFSISKNLYLFFLSLSSNEAGAGLIWIDQICIDQKNLDEKSNQVPMMADIYRKAAMVVIWLDPLGPLAYNLTDVLDRVSQARKLCPQDVAYELHFLNEYISYLPNM